nr:hypothetical protein [Pseudomonas sp. BIGb0427]
MMLDTSLFFLGGLDAVHEGGGGKRFDTAAKLDLEGDRALDLFQRLAPDLVLGLQ